MILSLFSPFLFLASKSVKGNHIRGCDDIDECSLGTHDCTQFAICKNVPGSWSCKCSSLFNGTGYPHSPCVDINECEIGTHSCTNLLTCTNRIGGYGCKCPSGFLMKDMACIDNNECRDKKWNECSHYANCTNTLGTYSKG